MDFFLICTRRICPPQHYPSVRTYVRAHDVGHGINLEKAGATAVIPEILEPSLQLAAAVLGTLEFQQEEVRGHIGVWGDCKHSQNDQLLWAYVNQIYYLSSRTEVMGIGYR